MDLPPSLKAFCSQDEGRIPSANALTSAATNICLDTSQDDAKRRELLLSTISSGNIELHGDSSSCTIKVPDLDEDDDRGASLQQYHCDACQKDISNVFRIRCGECLDFDLCVTCFTSGVETGSHRNDHSYIPIGRNDFPIFTPDWNADEEMMLLDGVSKFGFGNWGEIAELVAPYSSQPKRKDQCEHHYYSVHILPYRDPKPIPLPNEEAERRAEIQQRMLGKYHFPISQPIKPNAGGNAACNVVGFMPLRGDFDVEYDNDAELILSDIEFRGDESPQERELKLKALDIYNARVDERILRKKVVIEKGLVDWRRAQNLGRRRAKEEVDFHNLFRLLVRYDLEPDYEELANLFLTERRLRQRIRLLNEWRSLGLRTFAEVEEYERLKNSNISGVAPALAPKEKACGSSSTRPQIRRITVEPQQQDPEGNITTVSSFNTSGEQQQQRTEDSNALQNPKCELNGPASTYPGACLLTKKELEFCDQLQIPPVYFLLTKHTLINALIQNSEPQTMFETKALRLDAIRQGSLYDFVLHSNFEFPEAGAPSSSSRNNKDETSSSPSLTRKARSRRKQQQLLLNMDDDDVDNNNIQNESEESGSHTQKPGTN